MHHFLSNSRFSSRHSAYLASITTTKEPHTYAQAILDPNCQKAMEEEFSALQINQTWTLTSLPAGQKPIGCKWVYKIKYNLDGSIDRYKAHLVAKGYNQIEGVDYSETFSPTSKLTTLSVSSPLQQPEIGLLTSWMCKMSSYRAHCMKLFTWTCHPDIIDKGRTLYVNSTNPFMVSNRHPGHGFQHFLM